MKIELAYGKHVITEESPFRNVKVFEPKSSTVEVEAYTAIIKTLLRPLGTKKNLFGMTKDRNNACIVVDALIPPNILELLLRATTRTLHAAGLGHDNINIVFASEYPVTISTDQVIALTSKELSEYQVFPHEPSNWPAHKLVELKKLNIQAWLDHRFLEADIKLVISSFRPHYVAGLSGAPTLLSFGAAGERTYTNLLNSDFAQSEHAKPGILDDNPFRDVLLELCKQTHVDFITNVVVDRYRQLMHVFSGSMEAACNRSIALADQVFRHHIEEKYDIVVTSAGGFPYDQHWNYVLQSLYIASGILKKGGTIVSVASANDTIASDVSTKSVKSKKELADLFKTLMGKPDLLDSYLQKLMTNMDDAKLILVSSMAKGGLQNAPILNTTSSLKTALDHVSKHYPSDSSIAVLPDGLQAVFSV